jgi:hypothetical protein
MTKAKIKIERKVGNPGPANRPAYPYAEMNIGDAFVVPKGGSYAAVRSSASRYGKRLKKTFTVRKEGELIRVYRIE